MHHSIRRVYNVAINLSSRDLSHETPIKCDIRSSLEIASLDQSMQCELVYQRLRQMMTWAGRSLAKYLSSYCPYQDHKSELDLLILHSRAFDP